MDTLYSPQSRAERIIATGRVVLAASSLFAVWLDPSEPAKYAGTAYGLLASYLAYSLAIAVLVWRSAVPLRRQPLLTHLFDLGFFSAFIYFTAGPSSPFSAYFVFSLVCATLRWQWRGTLWTAVAALSAFILLGFYFGEVVEDPAFQLNPFIIRAVYLAVVAVLLGYLGVHEQRARNEISMLAAWPRRDALATRGLVEDLLGYACRVVRAPAALLSWKEREEPGVFLASWRDGILDWQRLAPGTWEPPVHPDLRDSSFLCADVKAAPALVVRLADPTIEHWRGAPLHSDLSRHLRSRSVLSVPLRGETVEGRVFFLDNPSMTSDDLALGHTVGGVVAAQLDRHYLGLQLRESAAVEERIRLARDLHDGVLQSLAGIALRLSTLRHLVGESKGEVQEGLDEVCRLIALEQRDLRFFIDDLKPARLGPGGQARTLIERLENLVARLEGEWSMRVSLRLDGLTEPIGERLTRQIYLLIREALVNAARHGRAGQVKVVLGETSNDALAISVADDGGGLSKHGTFTLSELIRSDQGPRSLRDRVAALGGELSLHSAPSGLRLDIVLPRTEIGEQAWR